MVFLTDRQALVMRFIRGFTAEHHYPPSVREVAADLDVSPNGAQCHLVALEKKGAIARTAGVARSIRVVEE